MKTTSISLEVLALLFLSLIPWPGPPVFRISCSRDDAKLVRRIVQSKWLPLLDKYQVKLPLQCPFHPLRDIFGPQHAAKLQHRPSQWTCGFCGKSFYEEKFLDMHFDSRHKSHINKAEDAVCLADYCDIMRCQVLVSQETSLGEAGGAPSTDVELWQDAAALRSALAPAATRAVARVPPGRRRRPPREENCPKQVEPDKDNEEEEETVEGEGDGDAEGEANHTAELCDADTVESALPPADTRQQRLADIQRLKASCDPEHLQALKVRCEQLVHDCIATLLLHLTSQHFKEVEEEMRRAVCWYLSCDRYWQDAVTSVRAFPWPLVLAAITLLTLAVCMWTEEMRRAVCWYLSCDRYWQDAATSVRAFPWPLVLAAITLLTLAVCMWTEEMRRAVCWYLSCDRYWQDAATSVRAFPWPLVLAATTLLTLAVCMCYYIIWIVFDSEEGSVGGSASVSMTAHSSPSRAADSRLAGEAGADDDDHYIYVTYPPDLKRRLLESCYNRTTRL